MGTPGVSGLNLRFELDEQGGQRPTAHPPRGAGFSRVFEEPTIPLDDLRAQLRWKQVQGRWQLTVSEAHFANADAAGSLQAQWRMGDDPDHPLPGILDLSGQLSRADGTRVHRYLPLEIPASARHYVRDSVLAGAAAMCALPCKGTCGTSPFSDPPMAGAFTLPRRLPMPPTTTCPAACAPPAKRPGRSCKNCRDG